MKTTLTVRVEFRVDEARGLYVAFATLPGDANGGEVAAYREGDEDVMKSEEEIRRHRDVLRKAMARPCDCAGEHAMPCFVGGKMMRATEQALSWLLGEGDSYGEIVEGLRERNGGQEP